METRAIRSKVEHLKYALKFTNSFVVEPNGTTGGLALFWNKDCAVEISSSSQNFIHTMVTMKDEIIGKDYTFIYGEPIQQRRQTLWQVISRLKPPDHRAWCCLGDFNEILFHHEKDGLRPQFQASLN